MTLVLLGARGTQTAIANGDTRTIRLYHTHTNESIQVTFKRDGRYDSEALKQLNWFLRDWRRDEPTRMEPRLFDIVWEVYREVGGSEPVNIVSAYRAPATNAMLRSRSRGVAEHSQHMLGRAMDFYIPGVSVTRIREVGLRLQRGGVGYYPTANSPFVHLDAGNVRHWPRMTRQQLVRLFPDGRTVHIPSDGRPLDNYELALADVERSGASVGQRFDFNRAGGVQVARRERNFFERLFGIGEDEENDIEEVAPSRVRTAATRGRQLPGPVGQELRASPNQPFPTREEPAAAPPEPPKRAEPEPKPVAVAAAVPVPTNRPAALLAAAQPAPTPAPLPSTPAGPRMVWVQGPQGQAGATPAQAAPAPAQAVAAVAPALPAPRPDDQIAALVSAYAPAQAAPAVPMPVLRSGMGIADRSAQAQPAPAPVPMPEARPQFAALTPPAVTQPPAAVQANLAAAARPSALAQRSAASILDRINRAHAVPQTTGSTAQAGKPRVALAAKPADGRTGKALAATPSAQDSRQGLVAPQSRVLGSLLEASPSLGPVGPVPMPERFKSAPVTVVKTKPM